MYIFICRALQQHLECNVFKAVHDASVVIILKQSQNAAFFCIMVPIILHLDIILFFSSFFPSFYVIDF